MGVENKCGIRGSIYREFFASSKSGLEERNELVNLNDRLTKFMGVVKCSDPGGMCGGENKKVV